MGNYSFSQKFIEGEAVSGFWNLIFYGVTLLNSAAIVYFLSVYDYGFYQLILSVMAIAESLTAGFIDDLVFSDFSRSLGGVDRGKAKRLFGEYAGLKMGLAVIFGIVLFFGSSIISDYYGQAIATFIRIASIALVFRVGISVMNIFFRGAIYFSALAAPAVGEGVKFLAVVFFAIKGNFSITEVLIAYVIGHIAAFLFSGFHFWLLYRRLFSGVHAVREFLIRDLMRVHGIWISLRYVLSRIANNIRPWIINAFLSVEAVGWFSFARSIIAVVMRLMPLGTFGTLLPRELGNQERLRFIFARMMKYSFWIGMVLAAAVLILVPPAISYFLPKYIPAMPLLSIMTIILVLYSIYKIVRITLVIFKEQRVLFLKSFENSILAPLMLFILLPIFGVAGAAIEWLITYLVTTVIFYHSLVKTYPYLRTKFANFLVFDRADRELMARIYRTALDFFKRRKQPST